MKHHRADAEQRVPVGCLSGACGCLSGACRTALQAPDEVQVAPKNRQTGARGACSAPSLSVLDSQRDRGEGEQEEKGRSRQAPQAPEQRRQTATATPPLPLPRRGCLQECRA